MSDPVATLYSLAAVSAIVMFILSIPVGFYTVFFTMLSTTTPPYTDQTLYHPPFYIALLAVKLPFEISYGVTFMVLTGFIVFFIALAAQQGGGIVNALRATSREGIRPLFRNPLTATVIILGASLLLTILLDIIQTSFGVSAGGLEPTDPLELLLSFILAPFIEEIGYRFFLIGVPLFFVLILSRDSLNRALKALWRPSAAWDSGASGGNGSIQESHKLLVVLLVGLSSVVFGLAHYLSGAGWSVGKIDEAALDGVALGYLYVRYGLHASIIYHWATDYALNAFAFYGQAVNGVPWTNDSVYNLLPAYDVLYAVGIPGTIYIAYRVVRWSLTRKSGVSMGSGGPSSGDAPPQTI